MITVNSLSQNKSELNISGVGLNEQYISVLIDGIISKIISISYRKIVVAIPQNARIKTVSVHLHINESDSIYYVNAGQIHLGEFRNGMPVAVFEDLIDVNNNDNPSVLLDSSSSTSSIMDSSKSSEFSVSSSSPLDSSKSSSSSSSDSSSSSSSSDSSSSSSSSDSSSSSSSSSDSDNLSSSSSSDSSSDSTTLLPYTVYRILGGTHWDDTVSYNGSAVVPLDNNPF